ncbi:MAG TPA: fibronectin type III domain-containing protein [Candidatus Acidoferrum sp.]|nr:fibronectin type III domain-containing protein [Candidatus Acidoferrum sp.]
MPATPTFTSTPVMGAEEGVMYSYQVTATSSDMSAITFELSSGPAGATLSGNTVTWTPTHQESRVGNAFTVKATTAAGGSATQTWNVTPNGTVNVTAVKTYWGPLGTTNVSPIWLSGQPYPAAVVPQSDGTFLRLQGAANPDDSFSIPNVPAGYYWLEFSPSANFWTSTSDFDQGQDIAGDPLPVTAQNTTGFAYTVVEDPQGTSGVPYISGFTDVANLNLIGLRSIGLFTAIGSSVTLTTEVDWSKINTLYFSEYLLTTSGGFTGLVLDGTQIQSNPSLTDGGTNNLTATITGGPSTSVGLEIAGSQWAALSGTEGPGSPAATSSDYSIFAQPYVSDRYATPILGLLGPEFTLLRPAVGGIGIFSPPSPYECQVSVAFSTFPTAGLPAIVTDQNYGSIPYGDAFPADWPRYLQYCQLSSVTLPRPNSSVSDTFTVSNEQVTAVPNGPVTPILSGIQSPTINGASLFNTATLNTTSATLSWNSPAIGQPIGYNVSVFQLVTSPTGTSGYGLASAYNTAKTSVALTPLTSGSTYVFVITAIADAGANLETKPFRHKVPIARAMVVSAPIVIATGATAMGRR